MEARKVQDKNYVLLVGNRGTRSYHAPVSFKDHTFLSTSPIPSITQVERGLTLNILSDRKYNLDT